MFEFRESTIIVTGPHRTGTTICAEMIGHDLGLKVYREEAFKNHDIKAADILVQSKGVIQGPYLLPWLPILAHEGIKVVMMMRDTKDIQQSVSNLKVSKPWFSCYQAYALWDKIKDMIPNNIEVEYESLRDHPLWVENRNGWGHRQTHA